ncbi:MAG: hypothetical protein RIR65_140 [Planctomycetota bacterium]
MRGSQDDQSNHAGRGADRARLQLWTWAALLVVVAGALAWSIIRTGPILSPLDTSRPVRAAPVQGERRQGERRQDERSQDERGDGTQGQVDPRDSASTPAPPAPQPGFDPHAPQHPAFDQAEFERQLQQSRPARDPR